MPSTSVSPSFDPLSVSAAHPRFSSQAAGDDALHDALLSQRSRPLLHSQSAREVDVGVRWGDSAVRRDGAEAWDSDIAAAVDTFQKML